MQETANTAKSFEVPFSEGFENLLRAYSNVSGKIDMKEKLSGTSEAMKAIHTIGAKTIGESAENLGTKIHTDARMDNALMSADFLASGEDFDKHIDVLEANKEKYHLVSILLRNFYSAYQNYQRTEPVTE